MRLAQLARKVKITPNEIKTFLENKFEVSIENDPNLKLEDKHIDSVMEHYEIVVEEKISSDIPESINSTDTIVQHDELDEYLTNQAEINQSQTADDQPVEEVAIGIDLSAEDKDVDDALNDIEELTEDTDDEAKDDIDYYTERAVDPNAELIKTPKIVLDGLKVLGKIDLPETEKDIQKLVEESKDIQEDVNSSIDNISELEASMESMVQDIKPVSSKSNESTNLVKSEEDEDNEYKNDRGVYRFSEEQRANRKKKIHLIEEKQRVLALKEKKKKHYEAKHKVIKTTNTTTKIVVDEPKVVKKPKITKKVVVKEEPKSIWGRLMNWLND